MVEVFSVLSAPTKPQKEVLKTLNQSGKDTTAGYTYSPLGPVVRSYLFGDDLLTS